MFARIVATQRKQLLQKGLRTFSTETPVVAPDAVEGKKKNVFSSMWAACCSKKCSMMTSMKNCYSNCDMTKKTIECYKKCSITAPLKKFSQSPAEPWVRFYAVMFTGYYWFKQQPKSENYFPTVWFPVDTCYQPQHSIRT